MVRSIPFVYESKMNGVIEALHIYDERSPILSHAFASRPLPATQVLPLFLKHPSPRPNVLYLPNSNPPTLVFSLFHGSLLLLATSSSEIEPLLVLEFLHRIIDAFEELLGAPLLAIKIESNYDAVGQILTEMCDAGTVNTTEPNALRDLVEVEGFMGKFLGNLNLPGRGGFGANFSSSSAPSLAAPNTVALPWRRANVRHTSNEVYADVVETLSVTLASSGRPLSAFAKGTIAFTSKVSGVPDIVVSLTVPSGKHNLSSIMELLVFHPCVRLARWRERPGELSFIPPDGRFILAGYEVDLLPFDGGRSGTSGRNKLNLPVSLEIKTGLGSSGADFEIRLHVTRILGRTGLGAGPSGYGRGGSSAGRGFGGPPSGTPASPLLQDVVVSVALPEEVRNLPEIRPSKGDASYNPGDRFLEWHIPAKDVAAATCSYFSLRCTPVGPLGREDEVDDADGLGVGGTGQHLTYHQLSPEATPAAKTARWSSQKAAAVSTTGRSKAEEDSRRQTQGSRMWKPSSASVSFTVKGWLPSGVKVESIVIDARKSRGLSETVRPYKGVKYLTISKGGVEMRC